MSVEFRQRKPGEYIKILARRKWLITLPTIAIATAIAIVVWRLPDVYESTTLLIVRPSTIPNAIVPTLSDVDLSLRINNIGQVVASRSSLEPLIDKYGLYKRERASGEPMELVVERMRRDIVVQVDKSRDDITNAFRITYRERDPRTTQAVTAELAGKYVTAQVSATTDASNQTRQFFEQQLADAQSQLDEIDRQRLDYMMKHVDSLPSSAQALIGQYSGLREQQKVLISELGRLRDTRTALNNQLTDLMEQAQRDNIELAEQIGDPKTTPAYGALLARKAAIEGELQNMLATLKPKNPDVVAKQAELDAVKREMVQMEEEGKQKVEEIQRRRAGRPDLRITGLREQLRVIDGDIARLQRLNDQSNAQIADLERRINRVPNSEVALEALNREYQTKKVYYDDLFDKKRKADLAADVATNAQGETIQVIDPANLPQQAVAPKRLLLMAMGLFLGAAAGLLLAGVFEVPRLLTIQNREDAVHYTGLPLLAAIPDLMSPQEAIAVPRRRTMMLAAGIAATIVSIPALAVALYFSRVFEHFLS